MDCVCLAGCHLAPSKQDPLPLQVCCATYLPSVSQALIKQPAYVCMPQAIPWTVPVCGAVNPRPPRQLQVCCVTYLVLVRLSSNSQPMCACHNPSLGLCLSAGLSLFWWCHLWFLDHSMGSPSKASAPQYARKYSSHCSQTAVETAAAAAAATAAAEEGAGQHWWCHRFLDHSIGLPSKASSPQYVRRYSSHCGITESSSNSIDWT